MAIVIEEKHPEVQLLVKSGREKGYLLYEEIQNILSDEATAAPKDLEISHLKGESAALQQAIKRAEDEGSGVDELVRQKQGIDKRIAHLRSRKG